MGEVRALYLDFEFNRIVEPKVNLVCCCTFDAGLNPKFKRGRWWLHNSTQTPKALVEFLKGYTHIIAYSAVAEARSFLALGLNPLDFNWIDLFLEYRMMTNHNDELLYGKQLVDGKIRTYNKLPPKWERTEADNMSGFKPTHSLVEATYKLTGEIRDSKEKDDTRKLIISDKPEYTKEERQQILKYCASDVEFLPNIWRRLKEEFFKLDCGQTTEAKYYEEAILRGRYAAHTAIMENTGYPINVHATRNFSRQIPFIMAECQRDINSQFPDNPPFKWKRTQNKYTWNQKLTREWLTSCPNPIHDVKKWMKTDGGQLSLSLDAFDRFYPFKHDYPRGNFGAQIVRFLKLKQHLYGFSEVGGNRKNFWDSVGSDERVRPYMNIYGAQSSRSQPAASGFMFLKPAWMRSLVEPKPGRFIGSIDYGQQEFFLSGLESEDPQMIQAYLSGDPYLYGGKQAGAIPQHGTKETHKIERDLFKNTYLGILYGMTKYGLSVKLTNDTGRPYSEDDAQNQIDLFEETFPIYMSWKQETIDTYLSGGWIRLPCGWRMWCDNDNVRSVCNVPIQGLGASIMREAVDRAVRRGCTVIFTLHDAIYIEDDIKNLHRMIDLRDAMKEAFQWPYENEPKYLFDAAANIKLDPYIWSPNFKKDSMARIKGWEIPASNLYVDERAGDEYRRFSKYFGSPDVDFL